MAGESQNIESLVQQGHLDEAKADLLRALQRDPFSADGYDLLGIVDARQKDFSGALAAFQRAMQLAPASTTIHNNLGNLYVSENRLDLAEREFRAALRIEPSNRDGNYNLGVLLLTKGAGSEAITYFERVHPVNLPTSLNLIRAYFLTKRTVEALHLAEIVSAQNGDDVQVHYSLGVLLASEMHFRPALTELEKADALHPETFEILVALGRTLLQSAEPARAELALRHALTIQTESPEALYFLAQAQAAQSRPRDALETLIRGRKVAPNNLDILLLAAQITMSQNFYEDAIPLLERGTQLAPKQPEFLAALGQSYFMAGKVQQAIQQFKKLTEVEDSARSYAFVGICYRYLGRFDEGRQAFLMGLTKDPHNASCFYNLGLIAELQGDTKDAEKQLQRALQSNSQFADAMLELANLRIQSKNFVEAEQLLRTYVRISRNPVSGYYKLGMVERSLHENEASNRDLQIFQTLSKDSSNGLHQFQNLFEYLDDRSKLTPQTKEQSDLEELRKQAQLHPEQPEVLYSLAEAYLKTGDGEKARLIVDQLDKVSAGDFRTLTGVGVLLARYRLYREAEQHFKAAVEKDPASDEVKFDLANAYFREGDYSNALAIAEQVSSEGRKDDAYLALAGDIYAHLGDSSRAIGIFQDAIGRNPDNDQDYLSLALIQLRNDDVGSARKTLLKGQARIPASGKIFWGLGIVEVIEENDTLAARDLERAVDLLPEWPGSYSLLGIFYFQMGQVVKAREVLNRFKNSGSNNGLDLDRIRQVLDRQAANISTITSMTPASRKEFLQIALSLADRTS